MALASLVADYSDSDCGESDYDEDESNDSNSDKTQDVRIKQEPSVTNFFVTTDQTDDDDEDNKFSESTTGETTVKSEPEEKLPNPLFNGQEKLPSIFEVTKSRIGTSVFVNPFEEAEQAKNQILEKHVKLTQAAPKKPAHQPVCWKFRKGKCHMGKNCRFFHDPENRTLEENVQTEKSTSVQLSHQQVYHPSAYFDARRRPLEQDPVDEDSYMAGRNKKKRFGVADHLLPPKKAFESLLKQREMERPWTLPQQ